MLTLIAWAFILSPIEGTGQAPETLDKYKLSTFFHALGWCLVSERIPFAFLNINNYGKETATWL
jgi:hypothetical protein